MSDTPAEFEIVALLGAVDLISQAGTRAGTQAGDERCGFDSVRPKGMKNTVMRRAVDAAI